MLSRIALLLLLPATALAVPTTMSQQGRLSDALGVPLDGSHSLVLSIYDVGVAGTQLWTETVNVSFDDGYYSVQLGASTALNPLNFGGDETRWLELAVDGGPPLGTRIEMNSVPWSFNASSAQNLAPGAVLDVSELQVGGTTVINSSGNIDVSSITGLAADNDTLGALSCADGQVAGSQSGAWGCAAANTHLHDAADVITGTFNLARLPVGTSSTDVAAGDHVHDAADTVSGTFDVARLPVGTAATDVAAGNHTHNFDDADADPANELQNLSAVLTEGADAGGAAIANLADPVSPQDAATKVYVDNLNVDDADADATNELQDLDAVLTVGADAGGAAIANLADPTAAQEAATKAYVDARPLGSLDCRLVTAQGNNNVVATCPAGGYTVVGGGCDTFPGPNGDLRRTEPNAGLTAWTCQENGSNGTQAHAICCRIQ